MNRKLLLLTSLWLACAPRAAATGMFVAPVPPAPGLSPVEVEAFTRAIESAALKRIVGVDVVTPRALDTKLELDLVKACDSGDDSACVVDFAQAMGVQYVLRATLGRLGDASLLTVSLYDGRRAALLGQGQRTEASMERLLGVVPDLVVEVAKASGLAVVVDRPRATPYLAIAEITGGGVVLLGSAATHAVAFLLIEPAYNRADLARGDAATWELTRPLAFGAPVIGYLAGAGLVGVGLFTLMREDP